MRLLHPITLVLLIAVSSYFGAFYGTQAVLAHGSHCGNPPRYPCQIYYAGQQGHTSYPLGYSHGIDGSIKYQNIAMLSGQDTIAHWISSVTFNPTAWTQTGFVEGQRPDGLIGLNPAKYVERKNTLCQDYFFSTFTPAYNPDYLQIYSTGETSWCASAQQLGYVYWTRSKILGGPPYDIVNMRADLSNFQAATEHQNDSHMEPNGTQCFGTYANCADEHWLWLYNKDIGSWSLWDFSRPTTVTENQANAGYLHNPVYNWSSFTTTGQY
jgi:hypothetical protein